MRTRATASLFQRRVGILKNLILLAFLLLILRLTYIIFWWYPYYEYKRNPPPPVDSGIRYEVQSGDYLFAISQRFDVPLKSLIRLNDIENPDLIYPGDTLRIPKKPEPYPNEEIIRAFQSPSDMWKGVKTVWERHVLVQAHASQSLYSPPINLE